MAPAPPPTTRPPDVEFKAAALAASSEHPRPLSSPRPAGGRRRGPPHGCPLNGDLFEVGSLSRAIAHRMPKVVTTDGGDLDGHIDPDALHAAESMTAEDALAGEAAWNLEGDGTLVRAEDDEQRGRAWAATPAGRGASRSGGPATHVKMRA